MMNYRKNDLVRLAIEDQSADGDGIGRLEGFVFFVKGAVIGDEVIAKVLKTKKSYAFALLDEIITPSAFRVEPRCPHHRLCGACQLQTLSYERQLEYKENKLKSDLIRIGGFENSLIEAICEPIVGMSEPYRYRNKSAYPIGQGREGKLVAGFFRRHTHDIIATDDCLLAPAINQKILQIVLTHLHKYQIPAYNESDGSGIARHVLVRHGFRSGEIMVCLVLSQPRLASQQELVDSLLFIPGMASICLNLNPKRTNVILGAETFALGGRGFIYDQMMLADGKSGLTFRLSPLSFYQVNAPQAERLYSIALEYANLTGSETVWDLFCGAGTISLFLAMQAKMVYGVDTQAEAIADARRNAEQNGIANAAFYAGNAGDVIANEWAAECQPDVVVLDPPRKGCESECLSAIAAAKPKRIVYISCDSATLARDLRFLSDNGYALKRFRAVDQFGQTTHLEAVALLERNLAI